MPKLHSSNEIIKVLGLIGFYFRSQKGSHGKFKNSEGIITIVLMNKKEILNILKGLSHNSEYSVFQSIKDD